MTLDKLFHKYKASVIYCVLILLLTSCTTTQKIIFRQDGSARVCAPTDETVFQDNFYKTEQITNLSWVKDSGMVFNIKTIDSLGNYLSPFFNKNFFQFKYNQDTLTFTDGNGDAFKIDEKTCCHSFIEITSTRQIESIQTNNSFIKQKNNTVFISKSRRSLKKKTKNTRLVIVFKKQT